MKDRLLSAIIAAAQKTPFRGRGGYSSLPLDQQKTATPEDKAEIEAKDVERFFKFFPSRPVRQEIAGKSILDFGSGYGGRTVGYVHTCEALRASGVEPFQTHIDAGALLARKRGLSDRVNFRLCTQDHIPYDDQSFDAAITFDVLEHVKDPRVSLKELHRVLKPDALLYAVFPVYRGAISHHLDYLTMVPALHLAFSPERIVRVTNRCLDARPDIIVDRHDSPSAHFITSKPILPTLNGMGLKDFKNAIAGWDIESLTLNSVLDIALGRRSPIARTTRFLTKAPPFFAEPFIFNVAAILRKRAA